MSFIRSVSGELQPSVCKDVAVSGSTNHLLWIVRQHTRLVGGEVGWDVGVWGMGEVPNTPGVFGRTASGLNHSAIFFWPHFEL